MVYFEVIAERQVPRSLNPQGLSICAASIVEFGTDEQKERFVLPTLKGEITWCLGMSEPNAGSDLASLTTKAERRDGRLRGERPEGVDVGRPRRRLLHVLRAHRPRGAEAPGHQRAHHRHAHAGHHVPAVARADRPDHADFNEVFFTDVEVPEENLLGELNNGWPVSQGSLRHERGMLWIMNVAKMERTLRGLVRVAPRPDGRGGTLGDDPRLAEAIGRLVTDTVAMRCLGYRGFAKSVRGEMSPEHMVLKLFSSEAEQSACEVAREALGTGGPRPRRARARTASPNGTSPTSTPVRSERSWARSTTAPGPTSTCVRSPTRSPAGRRRSSATSWPSACSGLPRG